jgi:hypothetical protein
VNFYAHAVVAERLCADDDFVLGAMLPDLATMAGLRVAGTDVPRLREGLRLHHASDAAFHACTEFATLTREGTRTLEAAGVRRGPARAASHVGVELLLDGWLVERHPPSPLYRRALHRTPDCADRVRWRKPAGASWTRLCDRLNSADMTDGYRDTAEVARRLSRVLARRPRLALSEDEEETTRRWLVRTRARVAHHAPALLASAAASGSPWSDHRGSPLHSALPDRGGSA